MCSENKGTDQLHSYCAAVLCLFLHMQKAGFLMIGLICSSTILFKYIILH